MDQALTRNVDAFAKPDGNIFQLSSGPYDDLNLSQMKAVATVCGTTFKKGFFLVHGPPGTGELFQSKSEAKSCLFSFLLAITLITDHPS